MRYFPAAVGRAYLALLRAPVKRTCAVLVLTSWLKVLAGGTLRMVQSYLSSKALAMSHPTCGTCKPTANANAYCSAHHDQGPQPHFRWSRKKPPPAQGTLPLGSGARSTTHPLDSPRLGCPGTRACWQIMVCSNTGPQSNLIRYAPPLAADLCSPETHRPRLTRSNQGTLGFANTP